MSENRWRRPRAAEVPAPKRSPEPAATAPDAAPQGLVVSPARAPQLPEGWTYQFTSRTMGAARIDLVDHRGRVVATAAFAGHAQSPEFLLAAACGRAYATWEATGKVVAEPSHLVTASATPEGDAWRVWCNQANYVNFLVDDPALPDHGQPGVRRRRSGRSPLAPGRAEGRRDTVEPSSVAISAGGAHVVRLPTGDNIAGGRGRPDGRHCRPRTSRRPSPG